MSFFKPLEVYCWVSILHYLFNFWFIQHFAALPTVFLKKHPILAELIQLAVSILCDFQAAIIRTEPLKRFHVCFMVCVRNRVLKVFFEDITHCIQYYRTV